MTSTLQTRSHPTIRDGIVDDLSNTLAGARVRGPGDDLYDIAQAEAGALAESEGLLARAVQESFDDTASLESLKKRNRHRVGDPLTATPARLSLRITGTESSEWTTAHTLISMDTALRYAPLAGGVMGAVEYALITVEATTGGDATALPRGSQLVFESPPAGITPVATSVGNPSGGTDAEDVERYRARVLDWHRRPTAGGTLADFERWALAVDGVGFATAFRYRRSPGTVDVAVLDLEGDAVSDEVLTACQAKLDAEKPALPKDVMAVRPALTPLTVRRRLVLSPGFVFSTFAPRSAGVDSVASAIVVSDLSGLAVGQYAALPCDVNGRTVWAARPIVALEDGPPKRVLLSPALPGAPVAGAVMRPGGPTYDTLAASVVDYLASLRSGGSFYNAKADALLIGENAELLNVIDVEPAADVAAVVTESVIQHLTLGDLILEGA